MADEFTCAMCHQTFEKEWPDEQADAECENLFAIKNGSVSPDCDVVCDDCWKTLPCSKWEQAEA